MSDVGIDRLVPQYERELIRQGDLAYWEVLYGDGTALSEAAGGRYDQIDRARLKSFRIVYGGEVLLETFPPSEEQRFGLIYRKRTTLAQTGGGRRVLFVFGWVPKGPAFALDVDAMTYRILDDGFDPHDPELYPPASMRGEPDYIALTE